MKRMYWYWVSYGNFVIRLDFLDARSIVEMKNLIQRDTSYRRYMRAV